VSRWKSIGGDLAGCGSLPRLIGPADPVEAAPSVLKSQVNKTFGRRFKVISFRYLGGAEI
jgi:hypothetical protein